MSDAADHHSTGRGRDQEKPWEHHNGHSAGGAGMPEPAPDPEDRKARDIKAAMGGIAMALSNAYLAWRVITSQHELALGLAAVGLPLLMLGMTHVLLSRKGDWAYMYAGAIAICQVGAAITACFTGWSWSFAPMLLGNFLFIAVLIFVGAVYRKNYPRQPQRHDTVV